MDDDTNGKKIINSSKDTSPNFIVIDTTETISSFFEKPTDLDSTKLLTDLKNASILKPN